MRGHGVAIAGHGPPPCRSWLLGGIPLSNRILFIETQTEGTPFIAVSYHAPPGVNYEIVKPRQAVAFASWLSAQDGPLLFGADANTPVIDALDFAATQTHWHTGIPRLHSSLEMISCSALARNTVSMTRCAARLALHPDEMDRLRTSDPVPTPRRHSSDWETEKLAGQGTALEFYMGQP